MSASALGRVGPAEAARAARRQRVETLRRRRASRVSCAGERSGVKAACGIDPAAAGLGESARHWRSGDRRRRADRAPGSPAGRRRASSATVEAPARQITRCARASRAGTSVKKAAISAAMPARWHSAPRPRRRSSGRACWLTRSRARSAAGSAASAGGTTRAEDARALAAAEDQQLDRPVRLGRGDRACRAARRSPGAPDCRSRPTRRGRLGAQPRDLGESRWRCARRAAPAAGWRGRARRSARGSRSAGRAARAASIVGTEG